MSNRYINFSRKNHTSFELVIFIFWTLLAVLSAYEGYLPGNLGGMTRYILLFWLMVMFLRLGCEITSVRLDQFLWHIWWTYYVVSIAWSGNRAQAFVYVFTITLMMLLCVFTQYFSYSAEFCESIIRLFKFASVSIAFLSIFFHIDIGAGTRRVLYIFNTYTDPNGQVATIAIGSGLCLFGIFSTKIVKNRIFNFLGFAICSFSIFQTGSRSGIVVWIVQILIILGFWHPTNNNLFKEGAKWAVIIAFGVIAVYLMSNHISSDIVDRLLGRGSLSFFDGTEREERWAKGIEFFLQHPIMGNGWGTFECHNTFLTMLVDIGLLGNLIFYVIIIRLYVNAFKKKDVERIMILTSGLLPAFFIGAQNKRFFWGAIILTSLLTYCKGDKYVCKDNDGEIKG